MKISVCMATYNGEKYIREQIESIMDQSVALDEICIVDDCSTDHTLEIIQEYRSSRTTIIRNDKNSGYVKAFERCIEAASGDVIFLSDQDDIWSRNKVDTILQHFKRNPKIKVVCHNATIVNADGIPMRSIDLNLRPGLYGRLSLAREFIKPRFFGCTCSFLSSLKSTYLPFNGHVYTHDHWLAINGFLSGGILVIPDKLIKYRRHTGALTKHRSDPIVEQLNNRLKFLLMTVTYHTRKQEVHNGG